MNSVYGVLGTIVILIFSLYPIISKSDGFYIGGNGGISKFKSNNEFAEMSLSSASLTSSDINPDNNDFGVKVFGGWRCNAALAFEAGYYNFGKSEFESNLDPSGTFSGSLKTEGFVINAVGIFPISDYVENLFLLGTIGIQHNKTSTFYTARPTISFPTNFDKDGHDEDTDFTVGFGFQYDISPTIALRGEMERYRIGDGSGGTSDIDYISFGFVFPL